MTNLKEIVVESPRISSKDKVIYKDKLPRSLYEYYTNGYKVSDIETLINNLRMSFEIWDKTFNNFRTSNDIMALNQNDISNIYVDDFGNGFIYSFATNKIYYYNASVPPHVNINMGISIPEFLDIAQRDFEALMRTPYGKRYITTEAVIMEGLKEYFGFGKALRIYIDGRDYKKDTNRLAFDKHSLAFIDALLCFSNKLISESEYKSILARNKTVVEIYKNRKLGKRDVLRSMPANSSALNETITTSLGEAMREYDQDPDKIYKLYLKAKALMIIVAESKPKIEAYLKKNPEFANAIMDTENIYKTIVFPNIAAIDYLVSSSFYNGTNLVCFDIEEFKRAMYAKMKNRLEKFTNTELLYKFEYHCNMIKNIIKSCDKTKTFGVNIAFSEYENDITANFRGSAAIAIVPIVNERNGFIFRYDYPDTIETENNGRTIARPKHESYLVNAKLFEYFAGYSLEAYKTNVDKCSFGSLTEEFIPAEEERTFSDEELKALVSEHITPEILENTIALVEEDRSMVRKTAHAIKSGIEKVSQTAGNVVRKAKDVAAPIMQKIRNVIDGAKKREEEESREIVITDSDFAKLKRFFRTCIMMPALAYAISGPCLAIVVFLVKICSKTKDAKMRDKIILELETELKLTREKINDANAESDKKAKYELMRIESKLEEELARIKYGSGSK